MMEWGHDGRLNERQFINAIAKWVNTTVRNHEFGKMKENADSPVGADRQRSFKYKKARKFVESVLQVIIGILMLTFLSGPLMTSIIMLSDAIAIPSFFLSFMIIPIITNGKMVISGYFPESKNAQKKVQQPISMTFSEIYEGVTSKNIMGLTTLLAIVYAKDLTWDYSAEVLIILVVCAIIGYLAYSRCFYPLWTCILAFILYPFSFALFYLLQKIWGWG